MSSEAEDEIIRHLRRQEWPLTAWLFGSIPIDQRHFNSTPHFSTEFQRVADIEIVTHFDHVNPNLKSAQEQTENFIDINSRLRIKSVRQFKRLRATTPFIAISGKTGFLILTPMTYWSFLDAEYAAGETKTITLERFYYEDTITSPRPSDEILQETWKHATKTGDRDLRYKDNISASLVRRYGVTLVLQNAAKWELGGLLEEERDRLFKAFLEITDQEYVEDDETDGDQLSENDPEYPWYRVLGLSPDATVDEVLAVNDEKSKYFENETQKLNLAKEEGLDWANQEEKVSWYKVLDLSPDATDDEIKVAHREKIKQCHPDLVYGSGLGEQFKILAELESKKLNAAKEEGLNRNCRNKDNKVDDIDEDNTLESEEEDEEFWWDVLGLSLDATVTADVIEWAHQAKIEQLENERSIINTALIEGFDSVSPE